MRTLILSFSVLVSFLFNRDTEHSQVKLPQVKSTGVSSTASEFVPLPKTALLEETPAFGNIANLMRGGWKIISIQSDKACDTDGDGVETRDILSEMPACALDDVMMVRENGKVHFKRNERCELTERSVETYDWTLADDGTFTMSDGSVEGVMRIKYVTAQRLSVEIPMEDGGATYHFTVTYEQE